LCKLQVTEDKARQMVIIQPALCFDTDKQAETLKFGIQTICWELEASKEEVSPCCRGNYVGGGTVAELQSLHAEDKRWSKA